MPAARRAGRSPCRAARRSSRFGFGGLLPLPVQAEMPRGAVPGPARGRRPLDRRRGPPTSPSGRRQPALAARPRPRSPPSRAWCSPPGSRALQRRSPSQISIPRGPGCRRPMSRRSRSTAWRPSRSQAGGLRRRGQDPRRRGAGDAGRQPARTAPARQRPRWVRRAPRSRPRSSFAADPLRRLRLKAGGIDPRPSPPARQRRVRHRRRARRPCQGEACSRPDPRHQRPPGRGGRRRDSARGAVGATRLEARRARPRRARVPPRRGGSIAGRWPGVRRPCPRSGTAWPASAAGSRGRGRFGRFVAALEPRRIEPRQRRSTASSAASNSSHRPGALDADRRRPAWTPTMPGARRAPRHRGGRGAHRRRRQPERRARRLWRWPPRAPPARGPQTA